MKYLTNNRLLLFTMKFAILASFSFVLFITTADIVSPFVMIRPLRRRRHCTNNNRTTTIHATRISISTCPQCVRCIPCLISLNLLKVSAYLRVLILLSFCHVRIIVLTTEVPQFTLVQIKQVKLRLDRD